MTLEEKFDEIIDLIEYCIPSDEQDIPAAISKELGLNPRLLGDSFQFITGVTLIRYIRQRRLIYALTQRMEHFLAVEDVVGTAGFSDAAAFSKACKNEFGLSPSEITKHDLMDYTPKYFAQFAQCKSPSSREAYILRKEMEANKIRNVTSEQFAAVRRVLELGAIYGFSDDESEFVYEISQECGISISEACEFYEIYQYKIMSNEQPRQCYKKIYQEHKLLQKYKFSDEDSLIFTQIKNWGYSSVLDLPDGFFDVYLSSEYDRHGWSVPEICEIAEALKDFGMSASDLEEIADNAFTYGTSIVDAIERHKELSDDLFELEALFDCHPELYDPAQRIDDTQGFGYRSIWELDEK